MTLIIISTFIFIFFAIVTVIIGFQNNSKKRKRWFIFFLFLCIAYAIVIYIEKKQDIHQVESQSIAMEKQKIALEQQRVALDSAQNVIMKGQELLNSQFKHLTLATLDLITPTVYKNYISFRLGLMWYWIGHRYEAEYHFRHTLRKYPNNIATKFNLAIILALNKNYDEASKLLNSIPKNIKSYFIINEWKLALERAKEIGYIKLEKKYWKLWQLPYAK